MNLKEIKQNAKTKLGKCFSCDICDGRACKNTIPGPGSKGSGNGATKNYEAWKEIELEMDTIVDKRQIDTSFDFFHHFIVSPRLNCWYAYTITTFYDI